MRVIRLLASLPSACLDTALSLLLALCAMHRVDDDELNVLVALAATLDLMGRLLPLWEPGWDPARPPLGARSRALLFKDGSALGG